MASDPRVLLWTVPLDAPGSASPELLSPDERQRAARFHFEVHRQRFIAARRALRLILGSCLDADPASLVFRYAPNGKPSLDGVPLCFNLSHSAGYALIAVAFGRDLGVDLEEIRPQDDLLALANRFFAPPEQAAVAAAPPAERPATFFRVWTRKEAYLKACGDGLSLALDSFTVSAAPHPGDALLSSARGPSELARWQFHPIPAPPHFAAALLLERGPVQLILHTL